MRGFRIGRISGIELRVDWSWVFIFVLLTWNLVAVFSRWHQDWSPLGAFVVAATASLVFFGCVLLHELAHSMVAMSYGMRVRSITLFLFGGVSNIEREPPSAKVEFFMAVVGPITSIALGVAFALVASLIADVPTTTDPGEALRAFARLGPLATLLVWLGPINVTIGVFNLIPGFPLDGGRIFRAIAWRLTGNFHRATSWASASGQAIGWLFIALGIAMSLGARLPLFGTGLASGIWLAFIGWFLHAAASQASTRLALDEALAGLTVDQLMRREGAVTEPSATVATLVHDQLLLGDDRALPVVHGGVLVGLVSIADVRRVPRDRWEVTSVASVMRARDTLSVATPDEPVAKAFEQLARQDVGQLPVVDGDRLVGVLRRQDVARWLELAWKPPRTEHGPGSGRGPTTLASRPT